MTSILGYLDLLLDPGESEEDRARHVEIIRRNGAQLLASLDNIVDLCRLEAGLMQAEHVPCSVVEIVSDVASRVQGSAARKGLRFTVDYRGSVPESVSVDPERLRQILMNLVNNAIRFTDRGEVRVVVGLEALPEGAEPRVRFEVVDTGAGIPPERRAGLFDPFARRISSGEEGVGGPGLGLPICRRLAEVLGGELELEDAPRRGSVFTLVIPTGSLENVRLVGAPAAAEAAHHRPAVPPRLKGRVLVAEDSADTRNLLAHWLQRAGLEVELAENGRLAVAETLAALNADTPYDAVLMDIEMPELDGVRATSQLRAAGYSGPVIALTANATEHDRARCLRAGCDDFAIKPISAQDLLALVGRWLQKAERGRD
jgi:CheY-like chemotaxis protein